jgi:hypothetical protein
VELVARFLLYRSFSHEPRRRATATDESGVVRKIYGTLWESGGGNARDSSVFFSPCAPDALVAHVAIFAHYFQRLDRFVSVVISLYKFGQNPKVTL